jgi:hypothetical protein
LLVGIPRQEGVIEIEERQDVLRHRRGRLQFVA